MDLNRRYSVLVVDDDSKNLQTLVTLMEHFHLGIDSLQETNAFNALEIAKVEQPDLIITDWEMPIMDGIQFINELKRNEITAHIPVMMCTGIMTMPNNLKMAMDAGADDYIRKPVEPVEFEARLRSMLKLAASFQTIEQQVQLVEKQKELLLTEVHHRVKNNLQIIISLMNLQLSKIKDEGIEAALRDNQSRVMSMSLVHQRMHQTANFETLGLYGYFDELIENVAYRFPNIQARKQLDIDKEMAVSIDVSIPLGLIVNEIVSNFYRHVNNTDASFSFESTRSGNVYSIVYQDNGEGFPDHISLDNLETFGLELISILTEQLDGEFKFYNENGAKIELELPIAI